MQGKERRGEERKLGLARFLRRFLDEAGGWSEGQFFWCERSLVAQLFVSCEPGLCLGITIIVDMKGGSKNVTTGSWWQGRKI